MATTPATTITERNAALWARAQELYAPTRRLYGVRAAVAAAIQRVDPIKIADVSIKWDCEILLGGSAKTATSITDLYALVVLEPRSAGYSVSVDLEASTCSLVFTPKPSSTSKSPSPSEPIRVVIDNDLLAKIWQAFVASVKKFTEQSHSILEIPEIQPRQWATFEDDPAGQMKASFSLGPTQVDVLPALQTGDDELSVLLRSCKPDGSNIVKSFSHLGARRIASLPDKAKHLICALKHVVKVVHGFEVPGSMFESVVLEVFEQQGWIGDLDEVQLASISFIDAWRLCWDRILSWRPISATILSLEEDVDLLSLIDKEELTRVGEALSSIDEQSLLDECLTIALSAECTKAAESYWWRSGFNRACDTVLGVLSICSCAGSLAATLLPADTTALAEWKHVLLPLSVVSLTVWYLGDWSTAAKKQLELHNKLRVLARRAKNIEVDLDNTDGISRDATSCAMSSPLQLTLKVLCMVVVVAPQPRHGKRNGTASCESARASKEQRQLRHVLGLITRHLPRRTESSRSWSNGLRGSWLEPQP